MIAGSRLSDAAVRNFHSQLDAGDYEGILRNSDLSFQNSDSHDDLVKFLAAVHSKLGPSQGAARTNIFVTTGTSGTFIRTVYKGYFEEGEAIENFTWRNTGSALKLVGYHIESKALITR